MCKYLSDLLGAAEPMFSMTLRKLEQATGDQSVDVRLKADIIGKAHMKMRELGLDPRDTTGSELYHALVSLLKKHDDFLARRIGGTDPADVLEMMPKIKKAMDGLPIPKQAWVLKTSVARRLLKATPPKNVMKHLGYKSIDSMIKREPIMELYGSLRFGESSVWMEGFLQKYKKLKPSDFETREIQIVLLDSKKWGKLSDAHVNTSRHNLTHLKEMGVVLLLPLPVKRLPGITITAMPMVIHYMNEIRIYSAYFKLQQVKSKFGQILVDTLISDPGEHAAVAGQKVHWRVIHKYFGKLRDSHHPEMFEPHVQPEDLHWHKSEEILYRLEPALHFWHDMDYVALLQTEHPVSFNLMDIAVSYVNKLPYSDRAVTQFRQSLWNELFIRYLGQKSLENQVLKQLDNEMITSGTLLIYSGGVV